MPTQDPATQPEQDEAPASAEQTLSKHLKRGRAGREKGGGRQKGREQEGGEKGGRQARRDFFEEAADFTPIISAHDRHGRTFLVGAGDRGDSRMMFTKRDSAAGRSLRLGVRQLKEVAPLPDGARFVDLGAEIGITAVLAVQEHGFRYATAVEPNPGMYRLLGANRAVNDLSDEVETVNVEPTKSGSKLVLRYGKRGWCDYQPAAEADAASAIRKGKAVEVEAASLDELAARGSIDPSSAALVRISTGRDPAAVLEGMRESAPGVPILLELDERLLADPANASALDTALVEHFGRDAKVVSLSEDEPVSHGKIAELAAAKDMKTASVLALGG